MQRWCNRISGRHWTSVAVERLHGVADAVIVAWPQVRVGVEGLAGVGVPERLLYRLDRAPRGDQHAGEVVPEVVERDRPRQAGSGARVADDLCERATPPRLSPTTREDQTIPARGVLSQEPPARRRLPQQEQP
jgi:hypothetical protein